MVSIPESPPISPKTTHNARGFHPQQQPTLRYDGTQDPYDENNNHLSVEDLSYDNIGYDADIEVVRPDYIEEPDSGSEEDAEKVKLSAGSSGIKRLPWVPFPATGAAATADDTDDELANKMRKLLSWQQQQHHHYHHNNRHRHHHHHHHNHHHHNHHHQKYTAKESSPSCRQQHREDSMYEPEPSHAIRSCPGVVVNTHGKRSEIGDVEMVGGYECSSPAIKRRKRADDRTTPATTSDTEVEVQQNHLAATTAGTAATSESNEMDLD